MRSAAHGLQGGGPAPLPLSCPVLSCPCLCPYLDLALPCGTPCLKVHPELLTKALLQRAQDAGGSLQLAAVVGLCTDAEGGRITGVRVRDTSSGEEREVAADAVVFCMGG